MWQLPIVEHPSCVSLPAEAGSCSLGMLVLGVAQRSLHLCPPPPPLITLAMAAIPPVHRGVSTKLQRVCFRKKDCVFCCLVCSLAWGQYFLTPCGCFRNQPCSLEMLGKRRSWFLFLSRSFKNLWQGKKEGGEIGTRVHAGTEVMGHRWGGSPSQGGGWQERREGLPCPCRCAAAQRLR